MKHTTADSFWKLFGDLPEEIRGLATKNFTLLLADPRHPSLQLKKVLPETWSVRVGQDFRAVAREVPEGLNWFWIGPHKEYDLLLKRL